MIGKLRHRITVEQKVEVPNDSGGRATTWATVVTIWGRISPASGREQSRGDTLQGNATHVLTFRTAAAPTIDSTMRVTHGGRTYNIEGIPRPDERERFTTVGLVEGTPS